MNKQAWTIAVLFLLAGCILLGGWQINNGGGGGSSAFSALTGGTNTTAAMVVGSGASLAATGTGTITATNGVASIATSGQGYFVGPGFIANPIFGLAASAAIPIGVSQQVKVAQFVLPISITVTKITVDITGAGAASSTFTVGIYSGDGNTKLIDSGTFNAASATIQTNTITGVTLNPGTYYLAETSVSSSTLPTLEILTQNGNQTVLNNNSVRVGNAANTSTAGGVLPATIGVITSAAINVPFAVFEP